MFLGSVVFWCTVLLVDDVVVKMHVGERDHMVRQDAKESGEVTTAPLLGTTALHSKGSLPSD